MNEQTVLSAKIGDIVYFFRRQLPTPTVEPVAAIVVSVGLNSRLEVQTFNRVNIAGGGRDRSSYHGVHPGDTMATSQQLFDAGTWLPRDLFNEWVANQKQYPTLKKLIDSMTEPTPVADNSNH